MTFCNIFVSLMILLVCNIYVAQCDKDECEVCVKYLTKFQKMLDDENIEGQPAIKDRLKQECRKAKAKENRFCYYIGGTDDAATGLIQEVTKPCGFRMPPEKICAKLKKQDSQICELKYDKPIDWKTVNFNKMRVKQLKKILMDWDEDCKGCLEKHEYINRVKELLPKYAKEEL